MDNQFERIKRGTVDIIPEQELKDKLAKGVPLRIKLGVDPTAPDLHLGHTVLINKLRVFQELGHHVVFIIGDFTARIGDPSGRSETRPMMSEEAIARNVRTYVDQVFRILDRSKTEVVYNSQWLGTLGVSGLLNLASKYTVARMLERDDFEKRYKGGVPISLVEFMYPLLQGYDSVAVKADVELGGSDQKFNLLVGRELQRDFGVAPQVAITMPLLEGTDGVRKMSKSYGNYIALNDTPKDMFGKIMSIPDTLMLKYYELLTDDNLDEVKAMHPREAKARLAEEITARYHGAEAAKTAREEFDKMFSRRELPSEIEEFVSPAPVATVSGLVHAAGLAPSKKEARRLVDQGAVRIDGEKVAGEKEITIDKELVLQVGKRGIKKILPPRAS